jgi:hypothetical protein
MSDAANRTAIAVSYLASDEVARRMCLAWPLVPRELKDRALLAEWARIAGVSFSVAERTAYVLRKHLLVLEDRTVDVEASRVITHVAAATLRRAGAKS